MLDALTLDQLRILIAVAETGSFSAAARRLGRVQSAISQSVQSLEATLGVQLFDRETKTPRLSEAGRVWCSLGLHTEGFSQERAVKVVRTRITPAGLKEPILAPWTQADIAAETGIKKQNVARALRTAPRVAPAAEAPHRSV